MDAAELIQRYREGDRTFTQVDLREVNLAKAHLKDVNLAGAILFGANLAEANLVGADLRGANLQQVNLRGADLTGANLTGANLRRSHLVGAILKDALLTSAALTGAILPDGSPYSASQELSRALLTRPLTPPEIQRDLQKIMRAQLQPTSLPPLPRTTWEAFKADLPLIPLAFWMTGYWGFGMLLANSQSANSGWPWLILFLGGWLWRIELDLAWLMPAIGGLVVMSANETSLIFLIIMSAVFFMTWGGIKIGLSYSHGRALKDTFWLVSIIFTLLSLYAGGSLWLVLSVLLSALGMLLPVQMVTVRYQFNQVMAVTGLGSAVGLVIGRLIGVWVLQ